MDETKKSVISVQIRGCCRSCYHSVAAQLLFLWAKIRDFIVKCRFRRFLRERVTQPPPVCCSRRRRLSLRSKLRIRARIPPKRTLIPEQPRSASR